MQRGWCSRRLADAISRATVAGGAVLIGLGGLMVIGSPQNARATQHSTPPEAQRLSNELAAFLRKNHYPVGVPTVRPLRLTAAERRAYREAGTAGSIGGLSLKNGDIEFSPRVLQAAARVQRDHRRTRTSFQLVKLLMHEQLHQATWRGRQNWFPLKSGERARDEGVTEALAWDLARIWCAHPTQTCTGNRGVVPDYASYVRGVRRLAMDAAGSTRFTARPVKVWLRAYLTANDQQRFALRVEALRQRNLRRQAALRSSS